MCVCELVPATTGRRTEGPGGDVPRARLSHPGLSDGLTREFMDHASRVLSRRNRRILYAALPAPLRAHLLMCRRQRVEVMLLNQIWEGGAR